MTRLGLPGRPDLVPDVGAPPCRTKSVARKPALCSTRRPWGFHPEELLTLEGNLFMVQCFALALLQREQGHEHCGEQPGTGFMRWCTLWLFLLATGDYETLWDHCIFLCDGPIYRKRTSLIHSASWLRAGLALQLPHPRRPRALAGGPHHARGRVPNQLL